jgi:hypothetical protein
VLAGVLALATLVLVLAAAGPAGGQASGCPARGLGLAQVEITEPSSRARVSGQVRVAGRASTSPVALARVELHYQGFVVDSANFQDPATSQEFELTWNSSGARAGSATLTVVACGGGVLDGVTRGAAEVTVEVAPPAPTTTSTPTTAVTSPPASVPAVPPTTGASALPSTTSTSPPTTTATPTTAAAGNEDDAAAITTVASSPPPTRSAGTPTSVPSGQSQQRPLTLTEGGAERRPGPPIWVGLVVGVSGTLGLALSAIFRRHHPSTRVPEAEPDPDLVDVS